MLIIILSITELPKEKWISFEDMEGNHLMFLIKKNRADDQLPFSITFLDSVTGKTMGGQYVNLIMESFL